MNRLDEIQERLTKLEEAVHHHTTLHTDEEVISIHEDREAIDNSRHATETATVASSAKRKRRRASTRKR